MTPTAVAGYVLATIVVLFLLAAVLLAMALASGTLA